MSTEILTHQIDKKALFEKLRRLTKHNEELSKYQDIIHLKTECEYLLKIAEKESFKLKQEAVLELITSQEKSKEAGRNLKEFTDRN